MTILGIAAAALLSAAPPSAADAYTQCINGTSTNPEWAACGEAYLRRLDADLNEAWKKANASLYDEASRAQLLREQRAWLKFRDASCQFYANGSFGREGAVLHFYGCRAGVVEARVSDLDAVYALTHQDER